MQKNQMDNETGATAKCGRQQCDYLDKGQRCPNGHQDSRCQECNQLKIRGSCPSYTIHALGMKMGPDGKIESINLARWGNNIVPIVSGVEHD